MQPPFIRPLSEPDIDRIMIAAGGRRLHEDASRRTLQGADYVLGDTLIELKALDNEGLLEAARQQRLAALFRAHEPDRPVVVIDRDRLPAEKRRAYDQIMQGPVKGAVSHARKQLKQSRREHVSAKSSVLFIINNGYTALDHESLLALVTRRARNDSREIDGVVVAGCYFHSDTFDSYFLWPIDYAAINMASPFSGFERLREAWNEHADDFMTQLVRGVMGETAPRGPVADLQFDVEGITYVKPAPPIGKASPFFGAHRLRKNSPGITACPPVAVTFPDLDQEQWEIFRGALPGQDGFYDSHTRWLEERAIAASTATPLQPFVAMPVTYEDWKRWRASQGRIPDTSISAFANQLFDQKIRAVMKAARDSAASAIMPLRYILASTEVIGQDLANDVSRICSVRQFANGETATRVLVSDQRMFHEHALAVASAYAIAEGVECVLWHLDRRYAWD